MIETIFPRIIIMSNQVSSWTAHRLDSNTVLKILASIQARTTKFLNVNEADLAKAEIFLNGEQH